jgi:hypothetical protein
MARRSAQDIHGPGWYTAGEAARLSGHSLAMLNYLCRHEIVEPSCACKRGHGSTRHYCFGDLVALRLVAKLSKSGISPLRLKAGMKYLQQIQPDISFARLPASHVVTDGRYLYLRDGNESLERATDGQYAFAFVVELNHVRQEVLKRMTKTHRALLAAAAG